MTRWRLHDKLASTKQCGSYMTRWRLYDNVTTTWQDGVYMKMWCLHDKLVSKWQCCISWHAGVNMYFHKKTSWRQYGGYMTRGRFLARLCLKQNGQCLPYLFLNSENLHQWNYNIILCTCCLFVWCSSYTKMMGSFLKC